MAKEVKRQPRAATRPPTTAVTRVDLRTHSATVTGDSASATPADNAPRHPGTEGEEEELVINVLLGSRFSSGLSSFDIDKIWMNRKQKASHRFITTLTLSAKFNQAMLACLIYLRSFQDFNILRSQIISKQNISQQSLKSNLYTRPRFSL